jgi:hypothetical protein
LFQDFDQEIDYEGMRSKVDKLVEQEMKKRPASLKRDQALNFPANFEFFKFIISEQVELNNITLNLGFTYSYNRISTCSTRKTNCRDGYS